MKKKYLVTGGTGFIGSSLVRRLAKEGTQIRVMDNNLRGSSERITGIKGNIELFEADIRNSLAVEGACRGVDCVIHLAYINGTEFFYKKPELVLEVGVKGIVNVIDGCIKNNVKELILASSSEVYQVPPVVPTDEKVPLSVPDPLNPRYSYGGGKIISELMAINYGRKYFERVVIFRPHNVYGPDMGFEHVIPQFVLRMKEICSKGNTTKVDFPIQGTGNETRAFIFIDDFTEGLMKVIEKGSHLGIYNIGTTDEVRISCVAEEVGKYFGREVRPIPGRITEGSTARRCPDITKLKSLGFSQITSLSKGIKVTAEWYDKNSFKKQKKI